MAQGEAAGVVVDLRETTFIDSSVLAAMIDGRRRAREAGLGFTVLTGERLHDDVERLLRLTGLHSELCLSSGRDSAIAAAREGMA